MITAIDKNTALVLIDLQKGVLKGDTAHPIKDVLANVAVLVQAFRTENLPVAVVHVNPIGAPWTNARVAKPSTNQNLIVQGLTKAVMPITGFEDIVPEVKTQRTDIFITKKTWNAFFNTKLHEELRKRNVTGIILAGVSTSIGVEGTARAASELGYNITFATDAMTDKVLDAHYNSLQYIFPRIGELGTVEEIIKKLAAR